ncbi:hypothetical protein [Massilia litorea]|uniref:Uncharacterized protein n=1 Tax=Massilia litorea TaxID=2769491 RepID=A0A7L9UCQ5_9BURK|nr:hypothetical protein [Massilia litorea]QOL52229.1 hypothetical protein LPB04_23760 [Massilia litorea]
MAFSLLLLVIGIIPSVAISRIHTGDDKLAKQLLTSDLLGVTQLNGLRIMSIARCDSLELADLYKDELARGEKKAADIDGRMSALPMSAHEKVLVQAAFQCNASVAAAAAEVIRAKDQGRTQEVEALVGSKLEPSFKLYNPLGFHRHFGPENLVG